MARKGKSMAVLINPDADERLRVEQERQRAADWAVLERIGERNADKDPDEVVADVTEVVEQVRQERYEREQEEAACRR